MSYSEKGRKRRSGGGGGGGGGGGVGGEAKQKGEMEKRGRSSEDVRAIRHE